jgi:hypothetical protein
MPAPIRHSAALILLLLVLAACASTDYLPVRYQLPDRSDSLAGKQVALRVVDLRRQKTIFGPEMRQTFRHFTGHFFLSVARGEQQGMALGAFDLSGLFHQAMVQRLAQAGVIVVDRTSDEVPEITVTLTQFLLDHDSTRWTARVDYRSELSGAAGSTAVQNVSGTEERFRLIGSKDVERVVSDIFTTMINRLDLAKLFADAKV